MSGSQRGGARWAWAFAAAALAGCAGAARKGEVPLPAPGAGVPVEDGLHAVKYELPPAEGGWQGARDGAAQVGGGVQVEVASFPLARSATPSVCRDTARARLQTPPKKDDDEDQPTHAAEAHPAASEQPRDQSVSDAPTATWSFTRGSSDHAVRSRWAFYPRGSDCLMLEVTGPLDSAFAETAFATAARSFTPQALPPERQRDVDLLAGMGFLERREPAAALERFEALTRREPDFARGHFGALMAGFEMGPSAYARALPHGKEALKADRELSPEQRQLALRAVGVMELAQGQLQDASKTLAELVVRAPDLAEGQYNYACTLAQLGDAEGALDHLQAALKLDQGLAAHARDDEDLVSLRNHPRFKALLSAPQAGDTSR